MGFVTLGILVLINLRVFWSGIGWLLNRGSFSLLRNHTPEVSEKLPLEDFKMPDANSFALEQSEHKHQVSFDFFFFFEDFMILEDPNIWLKF